MKFLLDTCVISELFKKTPEPRLEAWLGAQAERNLFISALTVGEVNKGIARLPVSQKRTKLQMWFDAELMGRFGDRTYSIDSETANIWGKLVAASEAKGRPISTIDGLIAATARVQGCVLVTRNTSDMPLSPEEMLNPWQG